MNTKSRMPIVMPGLIMLGFLLLLPLLLQAQDSTLISFSVKDQFDSLHTEEAFKDHHVLLFWGDRKGSEYLSAWTQAIQDSVSSILASDRILFLHTAHVKGAPFFVKGKIKKSFREKSDHPVLLDWKGVFVKAYGFESEHAGIVVFSRHGDLMLAVSVTDIEDKTLAQILQALRDLSSGDEEKP